jgi:hypothetical protein
MLWRTPNAICAADESLTVAAGAELAGDPRPHATAATLVTTTAAARRAALGKRRLSEDGRSGTREG